MWKERRRWLVAIAAFLVISAPLVAEASVPTGIIVRVAKVSYEPSATQPKRVLIEGVFALIKDPKTNTYSYPLVGSMYFECPTGQGKTCKMEWADIAKIAGAKTCSMFGAVDKPTGKVWAPGTKPTQADPYPIAIGVLNTPFALGICPKLIAPPAGDAGPLKDSGSGKPDSGSSKPDSGSKPDVGAPAADSAVTQPDLSAPADSAAPSKDSGSVTPSGDDDGGCAVAGGDGGASLGLFLLGLALALRRRRSSGRRR
jgi:MYXO-CTERM domain-containing protein